MLELLDLRNNNLSGAVPTEIREMLSLKHLWVYNHKLIFHLLGCDRLIYFVYLLLFAACSVATNCLVIHLLQLKGLTCFLIEEMIEMLFLTRPFRLLL